MKERDESWQDAEMVSRRGKRSFLINLFGILSALGIAFGGLILLQKQLTAEKQKLLESGGAVEVLVSAQKMEAEEPGETESTRPGLTQQELIRTLDALKYQGETYPHEPQPGQLSMAGAVEYGKEWMRDFLLPRLEIPSDTEGADREYRAACFLWTKGEEKGWNGTEDPVLSYWTISLVSPGINAMLVLNAVTGQVLDATISSTYPVEYQEDYGIIRFLEDYTDSFGLEADYSIFGKEADNTWTINRGYGDRVIASTVSISSLAVSSSDYAYDKDVDFVTAREYVMIRLSMEAAHRSIDYIP